MSTVRPILLWFIALTSAASLASPSSRVELWNGRDLAGWKLFVNDPAIAPAGIWSALADTSEQPLGEWNTYEIFARGDTIEVFVNGVRQNLVEKLPVVKGAIALQMEGFPIEFRRVWLDPL